MLVKMLEVASIAKVREEKLEDEHGKKYNRRIKNKNQGVDELSVS